MMTRHEYPYLVVTRGQVFHCEDIDEVHESVATLMTAFEIEPDRIEIRGATFANPLFGVPGITPLPTTDPEYPRLTQAA